MLSLDDNDSVLYKTLKDLEKIQLNILFGLSNLVYYTEELSLLNRSIFKTKQLVRSFMTKPNMAMISFREEKLA